MFRQDDSTLVKAAAGGDGDSFTELCSRYYPAMVAIAHSILGDRHLAEDSAQQAFAKAAVKLNQLTRKNNFAGWIAAICRNEARDMARNVKPAKNIDLSPAVAPQPRENSAAQAVKEALARLSESAREVIYLRFYDGLSYDRISSVLGISQQAINGRLRRAKKELAQELRRKGFGEVKS